MANVYVTKDDSSLYLTNLLDVGDQIQYDWSLSKSYTVVTGKGVSELSLGSSNETFSCYATGLHRIPPNETLTVIASEGQQCIFICPFLLDDDTTMNELFPNASTLASLRASNSYLISTTDLTTVDSSGSLTYGSGNKTFTLSNLDAAVLGGIST